jgi:hypothetical protein
MRLHSKVKWVFVGMATRVIFIIFVMKIKLLIERLPTCLREQIFGQSHFQLEGPFSKLICRDKS